MINFANYIPFLSVAFFVLSYLLITLEHRFKINKSAISLSTAGILWILVVLSKINHEKISHLLEKTASEIFEIVIFLLSAMTLVEILIHYNFFDFIKIKLYKLNLKDNFQFLIISFLTFFLSAILDNLTVSIVMAQIARRFFRKENLLIVASSIILMANAGGAWSPLGDVTTIMLWLNNKFNAVEIIKYGFIPSFIFGLFSSFYLLKNIKKDTSDKKEETEIKFTRGEKLVIFISLISFTFPLIMNTLGLPPYIGFLLGLGLVWSIIELIQIRSQIKTHLEAEIDILLRKTDIASLKFFIGILLSVSALNTLGILEKLSFFLYTSTPNFTRLVFGNVILGVLSALIDNVPLTAIAIDIVKTTDPQLWVLLAITVGVGGSLLLIGSVAGVIVMGMIKDLTFEKYFRIAFIPALISYFAAILTWYLQYQLLH